MKNLIYFPYFEPANDDWLKFSLLYLDEFQPIIPNNRRDDLSDLYKAIIDETDLVNSYSPQYMQGDRAGIKSIEELEQILKNPRRYHSLFNYNNILEEWKNEHLWTYLIYQEKYSYQFEQFCLENKLGKKVKHGLKLKEEVAFIFMTNLASEIAYDEGASIITDNKKFKKYANHHQVENISTRKTNNIAKSVVNLKVPNNINEVDFKKLIKFRKENRHLLEAFNTELEKIESNINNVSTHDFLKQFNSIYDELTIKIGLIGIGIAAVPLAIYSMIEEGLASSPENIKEIIGATSAIVGASYSLNEILTQTKNKRQCVKYFANLEKLH